VGLVPTSSVIVWRRGNLFFVGAGLCAERTGSTHSQTCPHAPTAIPVFVGAGLRAERARSTYAQTYPYAPTAAFCADPIQVFCRGEAEPSGSRLREFSLAPTPRHATRYPAPTRHSEPRRLTSIASAGRDKPDPYCTPTQSPCHCGAHSLLTRAAAVIQYKQ